MFSFKGRRIDKIAVVGSGQIGPDIALFFAKVFTPEGVPVVVVDVSQAALDSGRTRVERKIDKGVESSAFKPDFGAAMKNNIRFTADYEEVRGATLVVEAASEDKAIKSRIFAQLESLCSGETVFASNSSHMEPEVIFGELKTRRRGLVIHYFFPAERNPVVEIVAGRDTDATVVSWVTSLYEWMGKIPVRIGSRYGYAVDPVFEGIFQAAALCVEEGLGSVKQVDAVARRALGLGVGPFTAMNLTGGNPITLHGLREMHEKIMPWYSPPRLLVEAVEKKAAWEVAGRGEKVETDFGAQQKIAGRMQGAYLGLVCEILDSGIASIADLELAMETALVVKPPFQMMNDIGVPESLALVEAYAAAHNGFTVSSALRRQAKSGHSWKIPVVLREDRGDVAVVTIRRPAVLNAMNAEAIAQLAAMFDRIRADARVKAVVLTGFGRKAFVSGADIGFLSGLDSSAAAEKMCLDFQAAIQRIEDFDRPVVCALNGIAFGGGCEIAMGCHARIARNDLKVLAAQPEVNLGIIPGAGGTQRLPRIVGFETAGRLLRTGRPVSPAEALAMGLIHRLSDGDLVDDAIALANDVREDRVRVEPMPTGPLSPPAKLPDADIGHLSTAVDAILCRAVIEGGKKTLADGLRLEAKLFAEVCQTEDSRIGIRNFVEKGARSKAEFVNR